MELRYVTYTLFSQAIEILERAVKSKPLPSLYILLGKTKMKAKHYKDSVETFAKALELMVSYL